MYRDVDFTYHLDETPVSLSEIIKKSVNSLTMLQYFMYNRI